MSTVNPVLVFEFNGKVRNEEIEASSIKQTIYNLKVTKNVLTFNNKVLKILNVPSLFYCKKSIRIALVIRVIIYYFQYITYKNIILSAISE